MFAGAKLGHCSTSNDTNSPELSQSILYNLQFGEEKPPFLFLQHSSTCWHTPSIHTTSVWISAGPYILQSIYQYSETRDKYARQQAYPPPKIKYQDLPCVLTTHHDLHCNLTPLLSTNQDLPCILRPWHPYITQYDLHCVFKPQHSQQWSHTMTYPEYSNPSFPAQQPFIRRSWNPYTVYSNPRTHTEQAS